MGEEVNNAATPTEATVTASAPVETSTVDNSNETSEKTEISQEGTQDSQVEKDTTTKETSEQSIPKTRFDEVLKERNELRELKTRQEEQAREQERVANMTPQDQAQEIQLKKAQEALKKMGFMTQEDLNRVQQQDQAKNMFISEMNRLASEYNGKDGNPEFVPTDIAEFMDEQAAKGNQITDPETAYKLKHFDAIVDAKAKAQKSTAFTETQSGGVQEVNDTRKADLEASSESGDIHGFLKRTLSMPKDI